ncbi:MAG: sulfite exporter TauE/SafE family protein [Anaerolineales bacterium]|nr:sulfite exporter TauE/SafE family protein [Anaerolineales bacterium]MBS3753923.1 sulfite exporter TauE/SafE family protein [Anaerolineales bacterium]
MLTWMDFVLATLAIFTGAAVQGSIGFGSALIASPLLVLIQLDYVPGPLIIASLAFNLAVTLRESHAVRGKQVLWAASGMIPGSILAAGVLAVVSQGAMEVVFGGLVLLAVGISALGTRVAPSGMTMMGAGFLSGLMNTIAGIGGPPLALVYKDAESPQLRANLSTLFLMGAGISLLSLGLYGEVQMRDVVLALSLLPGMALGFALSSRILPAIRKKHTRPGVLILSALSALAVILREII